MTRALATRARGGVRLCGLDQEKRVDVGLDDGGGAGSPGASRFRRCPANEELVLLTVDPNLQFGVLLIASTSGGAKQSVGLSTSVPVGRLGSCPDGGRGAFHRRDFRSAPSGPRVLRWCLGSSPACSWQCSTRRPVHRDRPLSVSPPWLGIGVLEKDFGDASGLFQGSEVPGSREGDRSRTSEQGEVGLTL
jgi:hypothetical protein